MAKTRKANELRDYTFEVGVSPYAEGSCLITMGNTKVLCTASVEESVPRFKKDSGTLGNLDRCLATGSLGDLNTQQHAL